MILNFPLKSLLKMSQQALEEKELDGGGLR
jgi:hypothetical protein